MSAIALHQPQRSPEREDLATAIARHAAAKDRLAKVIAASEAHRVWPAQEAVETAEQELAKAKKLEPQRLVGQLLGDRLSSIPTVEQCEIALAQARTALDHAIRTRDALDGQQRAAEAAVESTHRSVRDAVRAVVQSEGAANPILAQYVEAQREVARLREILSFFSARNCLPVYWDKTASFGPTAAEALWRVALEELEADADVLLPDE